MGGDILDNEWDRLLRFGAAKGHRDLVALSLNQGIPVDTIFQDGNCALIVAAEAGHIDIVRLLLMRGARAGVLDAFTAASAQGHIDVVRVLSTLVGRELEAKRLAAEAKHSEEHALKPPSDRSDRADAASQAAASNTTAQSAKTDDSGLVKLTDGLLGST